MKRLIRKFGIIYPEDSLKRNWDIWITVVLLFTCFILPARLAFIDPAESEESIHIWIVINSILDVFFFIDIVICFNTAFYDEYL